MYYKINFQCTKEFYSKSNIKHYTKNILNLMIYIYIYIYNIYIYIYIYIFLCSSSCQFFYQQFERKCTGYFNDHHHHHIVLAARISLTLSRHSSLSFIALGRSSGQHPVSSHSLLNVRSWWSSCFCAAMCGDP